MEAERKGRKRRSGVEDTVVARYMNGRVVKGVTRDFHPTRETFHIYPTEQTYLKKGVEILASELKALFFVKSLEGNRNYIKKREFPRGHLKSKGKKCVIAFKDGEIFYAYSQSYDRGKAGFFVFPADEESNNKRVYVLRDAIIGIQFVEESESDSEVASDGVVREAARVRTSAAAPSPAVAAPESGGPEIFRAEIRKEYETVLGHYTRGHERDFEKSLEELLKSVWFEDVTKLVTKRGLLSFGRRARYFARGGIKEMGRSNDPEIGWPDFEAVPKFSNSLSEMYSRGKKLEHFSMDERLKIRKYISRVHNDPNEPIHLVAGGLAAWNGFELSFYDSREEFYTVFTVKKAAGMEERIYGLASSGGKILINDAPIPIAVNERVILALVWERNFTFHPNNPVRRFS